MRRRYNRTSSSSRRRHTGWPHKTVEDCASLVARESRLRCLVVTTLLSTLLSACASSGVGSPQLGALPSGDTPTVPGTVVDVYGVVARNALVCWFGANGPLRPTHIFHADVPSAAPAAEIALHERDPTQPNPRGARAFLINLSEDGGGQSTRIVIENKKIAADLGDAMRQDVLGWARGAQGCLAQIVRPPPPIVAPAPAKKVKKKA